VVETGGLAGLSMVRDRTEDKVPKGTSDPSLMKRSVEVRNVPTNLTEKMLKKAFASFGNVLHIEHVKEGVDKRNDPDKDNGSTWEV